MELAAALWMLRLDQMAIRVRDEFRGHEIDHIFLKGQSTAGWLYVHGDRVSSDVDVLVPPDQFDLAVSVLNSIGYQEDSPDWSRFEKVPHALCLSRQDGMKIDLHRTLHTVDAPHEAVWAALWRRRDELKLGTEVITVLDLAGRGLVVALHALADAELVTPAREDLKRAVDEMNVSGWQEVMALADELACADSVRAALGLVRAGMPIRAQLPHGPPPRPLVALRAEHAPNGALLLEQAMKLHGRDRFLAIGRGIFPTPAYMRYHFADAAGSRGSLAKRYVQRAGVIVCDTVPSIRAWRKARRGARS